MQFAVIGAGVIGAGWVARFLLMGFDVKIFDPDPNAQKIIEQTLKIIKKMCKICMSGPHSGPHGKSMETSCKVCMSGP